MLQTPSFPLPLKARVGSGQKTFPHELIGQEVEVVHFPNSSLRGVKGKVIDETRSTLVIEQAGKTRTLLKSSLTFRLSRTGQLIEGKTLIKRPEERMK